MTEQAMSRITDVLALAARGAPERWEATLRESFPDDPELVRQGLLWLRADRESAGVDEVPSLGAGDARYQLGVLLDAGATASVWQAHDRTLGRNVAIKIFRADRSGAVDEILAEARAACEVTSDHVVRVLDVHDDGTHRYIVMELIGEYDPRHDGLVPARSAAICRPTSVEEAVRWLLDISRGLHDAHLRNVFHRDLKPANVLITPLSRRARIADFGIAISAERVDTSGLVAGGVRVAGTPEYMAPEQARGLPRGLSPHDVDGRQALVRVDVWGLGALAYDLLAGSPPWQATRDALAWEVAATGQRPPVPARTPTGERVPARLRRIVDKAMAIDPANRYATAAELGRELGAVLERRPTSLDRSPVIRLALWSRRNPQLTMTAIGALALAAAVLVAYVSIRHLRGERAELAAETAKAEIENQELADRMRTTRAELERTEAGLALQVTALDHLRHALAEEQKEYQAIIDAKEHALHDADVATKRLVEQLGEVHSDRDVAEYGRGLYEGFWTSARKDVERLTGERDQVTGERDVARGERDQATKERDAARAARAQAEADRDVARATADQATAERAAAQAELARVSASLRAKEIAPHDASP